MTVRDTVLPAATGRDTATAVLTHRERQHDRCGSRTPMSQTCRDALRLYNTPILDTSRAARGGSSADHASWRVRIRVDLQDEVVFDGEVGSNDRNLWGCVG